MEVFTMQRLERNLPRLGRLFLSVIFLWSAWGKITGWSGVAGYMSSRGIPFVPLLLAGAVLVEAAGGVALLTGYFNRVGALALAAFLVPTTLLFHNFWAYPASEQYLQMINFLKNLAIIGGLLVVAGLPETRPGVGEPQTGPEPSAHPNTDDVGGAVTARR
jgi:putative oxidoreductase